MDHEELLRDIAALGEEFDRLGTRLAEAAQALRDQGTAPSSRLLDDLAAARVGFQRLRARVVEVAGDAEHGPLPLHDDLDSLRSLLALIQDLAARRQRFAAIEQARQAALAILDRVAVLGHREEAPFAPLAACQAAATALRQAVEAATGGLHPDVEPLVTGAHPLAILVTFVHRLGDLRDEEWERLRDAVAGAFGRPLALAASRGKLVFTTERAGGAGAPLSHSSAPAPVAPAPTRWSDEVDEVARALESDGAWSAPAPPPEAPAPRVEPTPIRAEMMPSPTPEPQGPAAPALVPPPLQAPPPAAAPADLATGPPIDEAIDEAPDEAAAEADDGEEPSAVPAVVPEPTLSPTAQATLDGALAAAERRGLATSLRSSPPAGLAQLAAMREHASELADFAGDVRRLRYFHAVAVGVGSAVAAPRAFAGPYPSKLGYPELVVLDSLDPGMIRRTIGHLDLLHTLFLVYAGADLAPETAALYRHCREQAEHALPNAGKQFVAITQAGSALEALAQEEQFRRTFLLPSGIVDARGGLSWAGVVPAALIGVNLLAFLGRAREMAGRCGEAVENPGLTLGAALAALAEAGRNKVTLVLPPRLDAFGGWAEQLLAGIRRADSKGLVPVVGESLGAPSSYGPDRFFVSIAFVGEPELETRLQALEVVGHPVYRIVLRDPLDLGAEMVRWQVAAATAGALLDVPSEVPARKEAPARLGRRLGEGRPTVQEGGLRLFTDPPAKLATVAEGLSALLAQAKAGGCVTLLPYLATDSESATLLSALRMVLRDRLKLATRVGRSTGYLQAAGEPGADGLFLQITSDDREDLPVPGERQTFGGLKRSQAIADFQSLREAGRAVVRVHLDGVPAAGLRRLNEMVARALVKT